MFPPENILMLSQYSISAQLTMELFLFSRTEKLTHCTVQNKKSFLSSFKSIFYLSEIKISNSLLAKRTSRPVTQGWNLPFSSRGQKEIRSMDGYCLPFSGSCKCTVSTAFKSSLTECTELEDDSLIYLVFR